MRLPDLRRFLLGLIGPHANAPLAAQLSYDNWQQVNATAAQHRLQPHLHARLMRGELAIEVPPAIRTRWQEAHRRSGIAALTKRKALFDLQGLLGQRDIPLVALKGAWCAWYAYAAAAERPMRDIDVLVPEDRAIDAFEALLEAGYRQEDASARSLEETARLDKHLPPLLGPTGERIELHVRLWESAETMGWWMPPPEHAAILSRAAPVTADDPVRYPAMADMLAHFIIHAAYSNRLNGGPLALIDLDYLIEKAKIDWPAFWDRARAGGWDRGAVLVLLLVDRWRRPGLVEVSGCPELADNGVLEDAPDLLLQDLAHRKTIGLAAELRSKGGIGALATAAAKRLSGRGRGRYRPDTPEDTAEPLPRWFLRRAGESGAALLDRDVRAVASASGRLGAWLDEEKRGQ